MRARQLHVFPVNYQLPCSSLPVQVQYARHKTVMMFLAHRIHASWIVLKIMNDMSEGYTPVLVDC